MCIEIELKHHGKWWQDELLDRTWSPLCTRMIWAVPLGTDLAILNDAQGMDRVSDVDESPVKQKKKKRKGF